MSSLRRVLVLVLVVGGLAGAPGTSGAAALGTIKLASPAQPVLRGDTITLTGKFAAAAGRAFVIQRAPLGKNRWTSIKSTKGKLTKRGTYRATYKPAKTLRYRALLPAAGSLSKRVSSTVKVRVVVGWRVITTGADHTCGIWWNWTAWCWGDNYEGQLGTTVNFGDGEPTTKPVQVPVPVAGAKWTSIDAGFDHTCGVLSDGTGWCWGDNGDGELGRGDATGESTSPIKVTTPTGSTWRSLEASYDYTCGIRGNDSLWCWGWNVYGQTGFDSAGADVTSPHQIVLPGVQKQSWAQLSTGFYHGCALRPNSALWCWGANDSKQRADANVGLDVEPAQIPAPLGSWTSVMAGGFSTCGILDTKQPTCWGGNGYGQLGASSILDGSTADFIQIDPPFDGTGGRPVLGQLHTCGIAPDRTAWCWGDNEFGMLGNDADTGTNAAHRTPVKLGTATWRTLSANEEHTCGIQTDFSAWCWGNNNGGRLSGATNADTDAANFSPVRVPAP